MKILVLGAGVIGSINALKLHEAGCDITLLAHHNRFNFLKQNGVIIKEILEGKETKGNVPVIDQLLPNDLYDLIIVTVRFEQLQTVIPVLKNNSSPAVMFMLNNPEDMGQIQIELNSKKIILAFPGVGGTSENNIINYIQIKQQKTTIGEIKGAPSNIVIQIKKLLEKSGFNVAVSNNMNAWLKIHAVFITCVSASIIKEKGSSILLGKNRESIKIMVKSIGEGFNACKALGIPVVPSNLKTIFLTMPQWFSVLYWQRAMQGKTGTLAIAPHVNKAKEETKLLAQKVLAMVHSSSYPTPTLDKLLTSFIK